MLGRVPELTSFADGLKRDGFRHVVVMGMGGSSLCPIVLAWTYGTHEGYPQLTVLDIARRFEDAGVAAIIYTDVARDGMLQGINWDATISLAEAISIPVIASGGLASIDDIKRMMQPDARKLEGAIAGRALYDGRLDPAQALALIRRRAA